MALNLDIVGQCTPAHLVTWTSTQALLYALGVGAGTDETVDELAFVTENTAGARSRCFRPFRSCSATALRGYLTVTST